MESGEPQTARRAFEKIEALDTEPPLEFFFFFGKLLVQHGTTVDDVRQGQASLKQFVVNIEKNSEYYRPTLELLSVAGKTIEKAEQRQMEEAKRQAAAQERAATLKDLMPSLLENLKQQMVTVQGGTFTMGCTEEQSSCDDDEMPVRQIQVKSFKISKYEVTQDLWEAVMGKNPSKFRNCPRCPVENVGWDATKLFLKKLSALTANTIGCRLMRNGSMPPGAGKRVKRTATSGATIWIRLPGMTRIAGTGSIGSDKSNPTGWACTT